MYLVTGASGNVGAEVVTQLLTRGEEVRVFVREPDKAARWNGGVQVATGDFGDAKSFAKSLEGVKGVFLMSRDADAAGFRRLVEAAVSSGRPRAVFLSTLAAGMADSTIGELHKEKEDAIRTSGLEGRFLRPGGFMTNSYQWIGSIKAEGVVYNAMGSGKFAPIAAEDIAAVAVKALTEPDGLDETLELTGGALMDVPEQVDILARILGKQIRCIEVPVEAAVQGMMRTGIPAELARAVGESFDQIRNGSGVAMRDTVERVTGKEPKSFEAWAREHASRFA